MASKVKASIFDFYLAPALPQKKPYKVNKSIYKSYNDKKATVTSNAYYINLYIFIYLGLPTKTSIRGAWGNQWFKFLYWLLSNQ